MRYLAMVGGCVAVASVVICGGCKKEENAVTAPAAPAKATVEAAKPAATEATAKDMGVVAKEKIAELTKSITEAVPAVQPALEAPKAMEAPKVPETPKAPEALKADAAAVFPPMPK